MAEKGMKIAIDTVALKTVLALLGGLVERKNTIPVLGSVLIDADKSQGVITIAGTNLDQSLSCEVAAQVNRAGSFLVTARQFIRVVESLAQGNVDLEQGEETLRVAQGDLEYTLPTCASEGFPNLPAFGGTPLRVDSETLRSLISRTEFASTQEESRYTLSGAKVLGDESGVTMLATDGHRLAIARANGKTKPRKPIDALVPRFALLQASRVSRHAPEVNIGFTADHFFLKAGAMKFISRLLKGQFPRYEMVIPAKSVRTVEIDVKEFAAALRRVAIMADPRSHMVMLAFGDSSLLVSTETPGEGSSKQTMNATGDGEMITVGVNAEYLWEFLDKVGGRVAVELTNKDTQFLMRPIADSTLAEYRYVVMPMRT